MDKIAAKEHLENEILEDILTGQFNCFFYLLNADHLRILRENKDYFREYFMSNPGNCFYYARDVDECPRDDTRKACCTKNVHALDYALYIDHKFTPETWDSVKDSVALKFQYKKALVESMPKDLILEEA